MSKKKAVTCDLNYLHYKSRPEYAHMDFIDKKGRTMMSSVDLVINLEYFDEKDIQGYILSR